MKVLEKISPDYRRLKIHESSPSGATFRILKNECKNYTYSYFYEDKTLGEPLDNGGINENLEALNFEDASFDIFITQDVLEHVNCPDKVFHEIARVLKTGGVHIFTVPIYLFKASSSRIKMENGVRKNILEPIYHGNSIDEKGSLVTFDWGYDICDYIEKYSGMKSKIIEFKNSKENYRNGLEADFLYVIVSRKLE